MKIVLDEQETYGGNVIAEEVMEVNSRDPILFEVLATTIYTTQRWLLEYAQNARDVDPNWKLTLPSVFSPYCEFYDEGPSMCKDFMLSRGAYKGAGFCTVFFSTKRNSDNDTGGFGLGRLTGPQGTLFICRNEDAIRTYLYQKSTEKIPMVKLLSEEPRPVDVPVGVTVRVPVEVSACNGIVQSAKEVLRFFELDNIPSPTFVLKGDCWGIVISGAASSRDEAFSGSPTVVVGEYPFSYSPPGRTGYGYAQTAKEALLLTAGAVLWVPVADVDVALNRESLRYTDRTKSAVEAAASNMSREFVPVLQKFIDEQPTKWQAYCLLRSLKRSVYSLSSVLGDSQLAWHGEKLALNLVSVRLPGNIEARIVDRRQQNRRGVTRVWDERNSCVVLTETASVPVVEGIYIVEDDGGKCLAKRLTENTPDDVCLVVVNQEDTQDILDALGFTKDDVHYASEWPYTAPARNVRPVVDSVALVSSVRHFQLHHYSCESRLYSRLLNRYWGTQHSRLDDSSVWFPLSKAEFEDNKDKALIELGLYLPNEAYGIPKVARSLVRSDMKTLQQYILDKLPSVYDCSKAAMADKQLSSLTGAEKRLIEALMVQGWLRINPLQERVQSLYKYRLSGHMLYDVERLYETLGMTVTEYKEDDVPVLEQFESLIVIYPWLKVLRQLVNNEAHTELDYTPLLAAVGVKGESYERSTDCMVLC